MRCRDDLRCGHGDRVRCLFPCFKFCASISIMKLIGSQKLLVRTCPAAHSAVPVCSLLYLSFL
jgi:hypothetical protein